MRICLSDFRRLWGYQFDCGLLLAAGTLPQTVSVSTHQIMIVIMVGLTRLFISRGLRNGVAARGWPSKVCCSDPFVHRFIYCIGDLVYSLASSLKGHALTDMLMKSQHSIAIGLPFELSSHCINWSEKDPKTMLWPAR